MCSGCHKIIHQDNDGMSSSATIKKGIEKSKFEGVVIGSATLRTDSLENEVLSLRFAGETFRAISKKTGVSVGHAYKIVKELI